MKISLTLILPIHNQENIIEPVLKDIIKRINKLNINYEILLIENGSSDNSFTKAKSMEKTYKNIYAFKTKKGYGNAVSRGVRKAKGEFLSYMPSDGQVDMSVFAKLWKELKKNDVEIVKVKRLNRETKLRLFLSKFHSITLKALFNTPLIDVNGSPRILKTKSIKALKLKSRDSFIDSEMLIRANKLNWRIIEINMAHLPRHGGKSTRNYKTYLEFINNIARYKLGIPKS